MTRNQRAFSVAAGVNLGVVLLGIALHVLLPNPPARTMEPAVLVRPVPVGLVLGETAGRTAVDVGKVLR